MTTPTNPIHELIKQERCTYNSIHKAYGEDMMLLYEDMVGDIINKGETTHGKVIILTTKMARFDKWDTVASDTHVMMSIIKRHAKQEIEDAEDTPTNPIHDLQATYEFTEDLKQDFENAWYEFGKRYDFQTDNLILDLFNNGKWPERMTKYGKPTGKPATFKLVYVSEKENHIKGVAHMVREAKASFTAYWKSYEGKASKASK
jgi:hypothetical protein